MTVRKHSAIDDIPISSVIDADVIARTHLAATLDVPESSDSDKVVRCRKHPTADNVPAHSVSNRNVIVRQKQLDMRRKRERQLTIMTMVMTLACLVCIMPLHIMRMVLFLTGTNNSAHTNVTLIWLRTVFHNLSVFNSVINFFLYVFTGSKFRSDLMTLFHLK